MLDYFVLDLSSFYMRNANFIDAILAFIIFLSLAQFTFARVYKDKSGKPAREGKMIAIALAFALTFGFVMFAVQTGFTFGALGALAAIILFLVFGVFIYQVLSDLFGDGHAGCAAALSYTLMYSFFLLPYSHLYAYLQANYPVVWSLFGLGYLLALIALIMCIVKLFKGMGSGSGSSNSEPKQSQTPSKKQESQPSPSDAEKLHVKFTVPDENNRVFPANAQPEVEAVVVGGDGKHVWQLAINGHEHKRGKGDWRIHETLPKLSKGEYAVRVTVVTADQKAQDEITLVIGAAGQGKIAGVAIHKTKDGAQPVKNAIIQLHETDPSHPVLARVQTGKEGTFVFAPLPLDGRELVLSGMHETLGPGHQTKPSEHIILDAETPIVDDARVQFTHEDKEFAAAITSPQDVEQGCLPTQSKTVPVEIRFSGTPPYSIQQLLLDDHPLITQPEQITEDTWKKPFAFKTPLPDGTYTLTVTAADATGKTIEQHVEFCVGFAKPQSEQPEASTKTQQHLADILNNEQIAGNLGEDTKRLMTQLLDALKQGHSPHDERMAQALKVVGEELSAVQQRLAKAAQEGGQDATESLKQIDSFLDFLTDTLGITLSPQEGVTEDATQQREVPQPVVIPLGPEGHQQDVQVRRGLNGNSIKYTSFQDRLTNATAIQFNVSRAGGAGTWFQRLVLAIRIIRMGDERTAEWVTPEDFSKYNIVLSMLNTRKNPEEVIALQYQRGRIETNAIQLTAGAKTFSVGFGDPEKARSFFQQYKLPKGSKVRFYLYSVVTPSKTAEPLKVDGYEVTDGAFVEIVYE